MSERGGVKQNCVGMGGGSSDVTAFILHPPPLHIQPGGFEGSMAAELTEELCVGGS